jgi:hypothetical protein
VPNDARTAATAQPVRTANDERGTLNDEQGYDGAPIIIRQADTLFIVHRCCSLATVRRLYTVSS